MDTSETILVDTLDPILMVDEVADNILLHAGDQMTFHWTTSDEHPGTTAEDFTASVMIDQLPYDTISYYPEIDNYTWVWTAPEVQTADCHLQVTVKDLLGNTTIVNSNDFTVLLSTTATPELPTAVEFSGPFPNPFNPSCEMAFSLPVAAHVDLDIFDAKGRRIRNLVRGPKAAGTFNVRWNGTDQNGRRQPGGLYFFVMKTQGNQGPLKLVRKALLIP